MVLDTLCETLPFESRTVLDTLRNALVLGQSEYLGHPDGYPPIRTVRPFCASFTHTLRIDEGDHFGQLNGKTPIWPIRSFSPPWRTNSNSDGLTVVDTFHGRSDL